MWRLLRKIEKQPQRKQQNVLLVQRELFISKGYFTMANVDLIFFLFNLFNQLQLSCLFVPRISL